MPRTIPTATELAARQAARAEAGERESLTELLDRVRFAAVWSRDRAAQHFEYAREVRAAYPAEGEAAGMESGAGIARWDIALTLDSIAESLAALVGEE